jgi:hypothetical protein
LPPFCLKKGGKPVSIQQKLRKIETSASVPDFFVLSKSIVNFQLKMFCFSLTPCDIWRSLHVSICGSLPACQLFRNISINNFESKKLPDQNYLKRLKRHLTKIIKNFTKYLILFKLPFDEMFLQHLFVSLISQSYNLLSKWFLICQKRSMICTKLHNLPIFI